MTGQARDPDEYLGEVTIDGDLEAGIYMILSESGEVLDDIEGAMFLLIEDDEGQCYQLDLVKSTCLPFLYH